MVLAPHLPQRPGGCRLVERRPLHDEDRIIVCKLRDEGLVVIEGQRVEIKNFDALSALDDFERAHLRHFRMSEALLALKRKKP